MDRDARLARLFADTTQGKRSVRSAEDARRFIEGASRACRMAPARAAETLVSSTHGLEALAAAARSDLSVPALRATLELVHQISDPAVEMLGGGRVLKKLVVAIVDPPTAWNAMMAAARASSAPDQLTDAPLETFAWLAIYVVKISFGDASLAGFASDVETWFQETTPLREDDPAITPTFRSHWLKLREMVGMRGTGNLLSADGAVTPGGRHDNDFADFRQIVTIPTAAELQSTEAPFYRRWAEVHSLPLAERPRAHLDNTYRLLREDMLAEIRQELQAALNKNKAAGRTRRRPVLAQLVLHSVVGPQGRRSPRCSLIVHPHEGLERLQQLDWGQRQALLKQQPAFLKHQSFAALCKGEAVVAFGSLIRDEELLCNDQPAVGFAPADSAAFGRALAAFADPATLRLLLVDAPVFAYEPILNRLKAMPELPLAGCLLDPDHEPDPTPVSDTVARAVAKLRAVIEEDTPSIEIKTALNTFALDRSQFQSLLNALEKPVSIIQGPPGTGKSLIGAIVAHYFLQDPNIKILVLAYKNHALDDFMRHLQDIGIHEDEMVRLGGSFNPEMRDITLGSRKRTSGKKGVPWAEVNKLRSELENAREELETAAENFLTTRTSLKQVLEWLEFSDEYSDFFITFSVPDTDDDGFERAGKNGQVMAADYLIDRWAAGKGPSMFSEPHKAWSMALTDRHKLLDAWIRAVQLEHIEGMAKLATTCDRLQDEAATLAAEDERVVVRSRRVVGCTTTAASKYQDLIEAASPDVVLVEEAAEILEAHVLAALGPSVRRLVLIGDHKQLRPRISNYALGVNKGDGFDLDRSLFERLVLGGHQFTTLEEQHRSPPQTADVLRLLTYPDLRDAPSTHTRPAVRGLQQRFVFVNHDYPEEQSRDGSLIRDRDGSDASPGSRQNRFEAEMVLALVRYLAQQGYKTADMVVLTPYLGQLFLLHEILRRETDPWLADLDNHDFRRAGLMTDAAAKASARPLRISTIDNYQGEQSDIVIVSLTRSNPQGSIGFLAQPERLTVLMSRHRHGLVVLGNMATFMASRTGGEMWRRFFGHLRDGGFLHDGIPVACQQHPDRQAVLMKPDHFVEKCPDGGCYEQCNALLSCGRHSCRRRCHRLANHSKTPCDVSFNQTCDRGHTTRVTCTTAVGPCRKCMHEDEQTRRRAERMLQVEEDRLQRLAEYRVELQRVQDAIDCEQRELRYAREAEDQKKELEARRGELDALKEAKLRRQDMKRVKGGNISREAKIQKTSSSGPSSSSRESSDKDTVDDNTPDTHSPDTSAAGEWEHMKKHNGAKNAALDQLMAMIGLEEVKQEFLAIKTRIDLGLRQGLDPSKERLGCTFLGNPGTGKTTVARIYAKLLPSMGAIAGSTLVETTGVKLASGGVPQAQKMVDNLLNAGGGVIFVDEAYQLSSGNNPGGGAVLDFLLAEVENLRGRIVFLLAGYDKEMEPFFAHNPGLPSRFPTSLKFADYTDDELLRIFQHHVDAKYNGTMHMEGGPGGLFARIVARRIGRGRGKPGFGNARAVENAVHQIAIRLAQRVRQERRAGGTPDDLLFTKEDLIGPEPGGVLQRSDAWKKLQGMVGLQAVKNEIKALMDTLHANYRRELAEEPLIQYSLNRVLVGNPGTGKTTVAKLYGRILVDLGMLSNGDVIIKNPSDFVGSVIGQSEQLTKGILASTVGKVLVIDEAYGLYEGGKSGSSSVINPYKTAVIDTIVAEVQSVPGDDRCVLLLGYRDQMEAMFQNVNPGLARRFPISAAFEFEDFDDTALLAILHGKLKARGFGATDEAKRVAVEILGRARAHPNFGNAGEIDILLDEAQRRHQKRQASSPVLEAADMDPEHDRAERADTNVAMLFADEVGREAIVATLEKYQEHVRVCKRLGLDPKEDLDFGFLFRGPPGTGKTTTAKKMGKVFYDMGFLSDATVVECSASALIGEYVGQTAPRVQQMLDKALGRVLFVDEAYRLHDGHFGKEALDELVDCLTKDRYAKKLIVILAGYDDEINRLLGANPGLSSRFPAALDFAHLSPAQCWNLMKAQLQRHKAKVDAGGRAHVDVGVLEYVAPEVERELLGRFGELAGVGGWGNARDVKTLASGVFRKVIGAPRPDGRLVLEIGGVLGEMEAMLKERRDRVAAGSRGGMMVPQMPVMMRDAKPPPPSLSTDQIQQSTTTTTEPTQADPSPETPDPSPSSAPPSSTNATRDAGVPDSVWAHLQERILEQQRRDEEFAALEKRAREADEQARDAIVKELLEEKRRREEEKRRAEMVRSMGRCPVGYAWVRVEGGWRCMGGSHFVGEGEVEKLGK